MEIGLVDVFFCAGNVYLYPLPPQDPLITSDERGSALCCFKKQKQLPSQKEESVHSSQRPTN